MGRPGRGMEAGEAAPAEFALREDPGKGAFDDRYLADSLQKWDLARGLRYQQFTYSRHYHAMAGREFCRDFLRDPRVQKAFRVAQFGSIHVKATCAWLCFRSNFKFFMKGSLVKGPNICAKILIF